MTNVSTPLSLMSSPIFRHTHASYFDDAIAHEGMVGDAIYDAERRHYFDIFYHVIPFSP